MGEFSAWLKEATPERREVTVCFDRGLLSRMEAKRKRLKELEANATGMLGGDAERDALATELEELEQQVRDRSRRLVFEGLGWGRWRDLLAKHPPTPEAPEVFEQAIALAYMPQSIRHVGWNAETFAPAAIAASCVEPGITEDEAREFLTSFPAGVIERIWSAVLEVNLTGTDDPFVGLASDRVPATARK